MNKIVVFTLDQSQQGLINKYCFDKCGKIIVDNPIFKEFGITFSCNEFDCKYSLCEAEIGEFYIDENTIAVICIRKLKEE